jgi:hypothetical protein
MNVYKYVSRGIDMRAASFYGRMMKEVTKFPVAITYPRGKLVFLQSRRLTAAELAQLEFDRLADAKEARQARQDKIVMWCGLALVSCLYLLLELGLLVWLGSF